MDSDHFTTNTSILCTAGSTQHSARAKVCSNTSRNWLRRSTTSKLTNAPTKQSCCQIWVSATFFSKNQKRIEGGIEPLTLSCPLDLKSSPWTTPAHQCIEIFDVPNRNIRSRLYNTKHPVTLRFKWYLDGKQTSRKYFRIQKN